MTTATIQVVSLSGATPTLTVINDEALLPNPTAAFTTLTVVGGAGSLAPGLYSISYTCVGPYGGESGAISAVPIVVTAVNSFLSIVTPAVLPPGVASFNVYFSDGINSATRRLFGNFANNWSTGLATVIAGTAAAEPTTNSTAPTTLTFSRADNETGATAIPIPQAGPASAYSYYKSVQLNIPPGGNWTTTISNLSVFKSGNEAQGLKLFWKSVASYQQVSNIQGIGAGNYPANDYTTRSGTNPNTPAGYTALTTTPQVYDAVPHATASTGRIGSIIQLVLGVADKSSLSITPGLVSLPDLILQYDEA